MSRSPSPSTLLVAAVLLFAPAGRAGWPSLSVPAAETAQGAKDVAVVVGIEQYAFVPAVPGALQNATDWYLHFTKGRGTSPARVALLRDREGVREKILRFAARAAEQAQPGGLLWFVFIGHGAPSRDGRDGLLVGADAQPEADSLAARGVSQRELLQVLGRGSQVQTVLVLDACFSGRTPTGAPLVPGQQPLIPMRAASPSAGVTLLTAGKANQLAGPLPGAGRPAFSYLLLGALRGWGDRNRDGRVTAAEATLYARNALKALLRDRVQTPELASLSRHIVLARSARERGPDLAAFAVEIGPNGTAAAAASGDKPAKVAPGTCAEGNRDDCMAQAANERDPARRAAWHREACDLGAGAGCVALGAAYDSGSGVAVDLTSAVASYRKACSASHALGCFALAGAEQLGIAAPAEPTVANAHLQTACALGHGRACLYHFFLSERIRTRPTLPAAEALAERCQRGERAACTLHAVAYRQPARKGQSSEPLLTLLAPQLRASCQAGGHDACVLMAVAAPSTSASTLLKPCEAGDGEACALLGARFAAQPPSEAEQSRVVGYLRGACAAPLTGGYLAALVTGRDLRTGACLELVERLRHQPGGASADGAVRAAFEKACQLGEAAACAKGGAAFGKAPTGAAAADQLCEKACRHAVALAVEHGPVQAAETEPMAVQCVRECLVQGYVPEMLRCMLRARTLEALDDCSEVVSDDGR